MKSRGAKRLRLGSYIVNAQAGCNDCHTWRADTSNPNGGSSYAAGHDPYEGQEEEVYKEGYLAGGRFFETIESRNLTPDKMGLPGGSQLSEFTQILRTGIDPDKAHPQFGPYLQVMPWAIYQKMTDHDIRAIYEYLRAIPCVEGYPGMSGMSGNRCN